MKSAVRELLTGFECAVLEAVVRLDGPTLNVLVYDLWSRDVTTVRTALRGLSSCGMIRFDFDVRDPFVMIFVATAFGKQAAE